MQSYHSLRKIGVNNIAVGGVSGLNHGKKKWLGLSPPHATFSKNPLG